MTQSCQIISHNYNFLLFFVSRRFLQFYQNNSMDVDDNLINILKQPDRTPLKYASLRNSSMTDEGLKCLLQHKLISLSLWYCDKITHESWQNLLQCGEELRNLEIGKQVNLLRHREPNDRIPMDFSLQLPKLKRLVMHGVALQSTVNLIEPCELSYIDLSSCQLNDFSLECLTRLPHLTTLILFNVWPLEREIPAICKLRNLQTLDISLPKPMMPSYNTPNETLKAIAESLPYLEHLDISGTNL